MGTLKFCIALVKAVEIGWAFCWLAFGVGFWIPRARLQLSGHCAFWSLFFLRNGLWYQQCKALHMRIYRYTDG